MATQYPYYCPLCMEHFKDVLVSPCCGNYTCVQCCTDYLGTKGLAAGCASINALLLQLQLNITAAAADTASAGAGTGAGLRSSSAAIQCPQCLQDGYLPRKVELGEGVQIKNYATTPKVASRSRPRSDGGGKDTDSDDNGACAGVCGGCSRDSGKCAEGCSASPVPPRGQAVAGSSTPQQHPCHSPVRVGDSFEALKRKMRRFPGGPPAPDPSPAASAAAAATRTSTSSSGSSSSSNQQVEHVHLDPCTKAEAGAAHVQQFVLQCIQLALQSAAAPAPAAPCAAVCE